jgi:molybdopterin-containing oxidoreductase family iron-sulfur binding subunit
MPFGNSAYGLIVESHEGRPTKIEGNKDHPSTLGVSNSLIQASILGLYDPDRSKNVMHDGEAARWSDFVNFWAELNEPFIKNKGKGLAVLSESFSSPTLSRLKGRFREKFPKAKWVTYEPVSDENIYDGIRIATGKSYQPVYYFEKAKVILSLDSDFLYSESENIANARGFADGRRLDSEKDDMNRLYVVESSFTPTGGMADHRMRLRSKLIGSLVADLIRQLELQGLKIGPILPDLDFYAAPGLDRKWIEAVATDLLSNRGKCLVVAGRRQPAGVHAMVYAINDALGNAGNTLSYYPLMDAAISSRPNMSALVRNIKSEMINTLIILSGNPVYNALEDLEFESALKKAEHTIHLSPYFDETSKAVNWHIPQAHYLESWGDAVSVDGTKSVVQPLIEPLFEGKSAPEVANLISSGMDISGYQIIRETWEKILKGGDFEKKWNRVLHDGFLSEGRPRKIRPGLKADSIKRYLYKDASLYNFVPSEDEIEIVFQACPAIFDGRFANNGWLQELPDPVTKLAWDNAVLISPKTAGDLDLRNEDMVRLEYRNRMLEMPVWMLPGQADNSISLSLGYGRELAGRIGDGVGFNAYKLRSSSAPDFDMGVKLIKTGRTYKLATTQDHSSMEGRPLIREATLEEYREHPDFAQEMVEHPPLKNLWKEHSYEEGYQWGMVIDLNMCIGCNACTVACQSENNIPIVGKDQVAYGREMHWIRLDRYFSGDQENPKMVHQPIACQHCENAPCEQVCPVAATVHDKEGLNVQVYNRCIGTRYCSNNCPYKVRRFNFFNLTGDKPEIEKMAQNPDVTVRSRGVMEKCTFCVQRINEAKINARVDGRPVRDGEIVPACQQSCPTEAILFGDVNDPESKVSSLKKHNRNYDLLAEYNTRPRTSFLAGIRNPNPELAYLDIKEKLN